VYVSHKKMKLRKFCLFYPAGTDLKQMIGRRIIFQIMQTTQAFVILTSQIDDPIVANFCRQAHVVVRERNPGHELKPCA
jgi:hypothetical protein